MTCSSSLPPRFKNVPVPGIAHLLILVAASSKLSWTEIDPILLSGRDAVSVAI